MGEGSACDGAEPGFKGLKDIRLSFVQEGQGGFPQVLGDAVDRLGHATGDGADGVAVAP